MPSLISVVCQSSQSDKVAKTMRTKIMKMTMTTVMMMIVMMMIPRVMMMMMTMVCIYVSSLNPGLLKWPCSKRRGRMKDEETISEQNSKAF